jgi:hypothetical protein
VGVSRDRRPKAKTWRLTNGRINNGYFSEDMIVELKNMDSGEQNDSLLMDII